MRFLSVVPVLLAVCVPATAQNAPEQPETVTVRDIFSGTKEVRPDWEEINKHKLGSADNPVRCDMPEGERLYLSRLRCPGGKRPEFSRDGGTGAGPYGAIMDRYTVKCPDSDEMKPQTVYMDMYHPDYREDRPVPGFTIVKLPETVHPER
ncbi:MAG: hypothetical protein ACLFV8_07670 [Alphaproteobacteria bacterium]